jgi:hypothetical protein
LAVRIAVQFVILMRVELDTLQREIAQLEERNQFAVRALQANEQTLDRERSVSRDLVQVPDLSRSI